MGFKNLLITGGAGFVGSNLAVLFREARPDLGVMVLDNLKRRGSELNLPRLRAAGVGFRHGDIRSTDDFDDLPPYDLMIDCSAEPSVQAGLGGSPRGVLGTNLIGTINCLEAARTQGAAFLFLSTSRIYPIEALNDLPFTETDTRFRWDDVAGIRGFSQRGIAEDFTLDGARSFYGTSKLAGEQLIEEYVFSYGMRALIDRCGVIAGPWQMGKVDQGVITLWVARHYFERPLRYTGFDGQGKQVRDILHIHDLFSLILLQLEAPEWWDGRVYNAGGGNNGSVSLRELTGLCVQETGKTVPITPIPETAGVDLRVYVTDAHKAEIDFGWRPTRDPSRIVRDVRTWIEEHEEMLESLLA
jgi:CDP-paratose 2-epimerase